MRIAGSFRRGLLGLGFLAGLGLVTWVKYGPEALRAADADKPSRAAVENARTTVKMLDDLYKNFVVQITDTYVKAEEKKPAAGVVKKVFKAMVEKGWPYARLIDATGNPVNRNNLPKTAFEKAAVAKLKAGRAYYEEVGTDNGKPVLRAATKVPVVMKQCITCHPGTKEGQLLGAIVYTVPIR